jgi:hypothetical protein
LRMMFLLGWRSDSISCSWNIFLNRNYFIEFNLQDLINFWFISRIFCPPKERIVQSSFTSHDETYEIYNFTNMMEEVANEIAWPNDKEWVLKCLLPRFYFWVNFLKVEFKRIAKTFIFWAAFWPKLSKDTQTIEKSLNFKTSFCHNNLFLDLH